MVQYRRTLKRIELPGQARYLTCSCYHRLPLFANDCIKDAFRDQLTLVRTTLPIELYAWVVMANHFHLLLMSRLPRVTVTEVLRTLKQPLAQRILARWRELDAPILKRLRDARGREHFWQPGGGYDRNIVSSQELLEKINYIHANPVRRELCAHPTDWIWSSARWYEGDRAAGPPIDPLP